ncbi:hypothetical protein ACTMU2_32690 [Cupriavidus basilensis]
MPAEKSSLAAYLPRCRTGSCHCQQKLPERVERRSRPVLEGDVLKPPGR